MGCRRGSRFYYWKNILKKYGFTEMPDQIIDILGRGLNKVNTRIYVPAGSVILESSTENIKTLYDKDLKKTIFLTIGICQKFNNSRLIICFFASLKIIF